MLVASDSAPTVVLGELPPSVLRPPGMMVSGAAPLPKGPVVRQGVSPFFAYALVGLLALLIGGGIVAWILSREKSASPSSPSMGETRGTVAASPTPSPRTNADQPTDSAPAPVRTDPPAVETPLTEIAVQELLGRWKAAQDQQNFPAYQDCYAAPFDGYMITLTGRSKSYDYDLWMRDRRKMIANAINLSVELIDLRIEVKGQVATVQFDQYYRSVKYSDHGPKTMRVLMTPNGPKIVYERLNASYPL